MENVKFQKLMNRYKLKIVSPILNKVDASNALKDSTYKIILVKKLMYFAKIMTDLQEPVQIAILASSSKEINAYLKYDLNAHN